MNILQVCLKPPYPKVDGGCMAMAAITESLLLGKHEVKCLTMATHKHPFRLEKVPQKIQDETKIESVQIDTKIKPFDALINLFGSASYNIERFESEEFEAKLISILAADDYDTIILESLFCTPYIASIRKVSTAKIIVRAHNVEFQIWEALALGQSSFLKKQYLGLLARRMKAYEIKALNNVDGILCITEEDKRELEQLGVNTPIDVQPIGMNISALQYKTPKIGAANLYHVGAMDWEPNIEGVNWFVDDIWPLLTERFPTLKCHLAGRKMPDYLIQQSTENLVVQGEVDSVKAFTEDKNVAIVPLLSGSGLRVKIVEALALGKVVITTSVGAMGIPYSDGQNMLIANSPEEFVAQIEKLIQKPILVQEISKSARKLAESEFDLHNLSTKLTYFCQQKS
ncbi:MAG: glycosyltransferase [Flavobacteriales bacterium]